MFKKRPIAVVYGEVTFERQGDTLWMEEYQVRIKRMGREKALSHLLPDILSPILKSSCFHQYLHVSRFFNIKHRYLHIKRRVVDVQCFFSFLFFS